ncbi:very short patch repair endonuclease [Pandoraea fibrosis]|nr:very short patch repair endonuclease [Pandoraea fibrosis]
MSNIRAKDTKPEMIVRRYLHAHGFRFRLHDRRLPGTPDLVLRKYRTVIFVHGCFWHHHAGCPKAYVPASNTDQWMRKFELNRARDARCSEMLAIAGWSIIVVWECELGANRSATTLLKLRETLLGSL